MSTLETVKSLTRSTYYGAGLLLTLALSACGGAGGGGAGYNGGTLEGTNIRTVQIAGHISDAADAIIMLDASDGQSVSTSTDSDGNFSGVGLQAPIAELRLSIEANSGSDTIALGAVPQNAESIFVEAKLSNGKLSGVHVQIDSSTQDPAIGDAASNSDDDHPNRQKTPPKGTPTPASTPTPAPLSGNGPGASPTSQDNPPTPAPDVQSAPQQDNGATSTGSQGSGQTNNGGGSGISVSSGGGSGFGNSGSGGGGGTGSTSSGSGNGSTGTAGGIAGLQPVPPL